MVLVLELLLLVLELVLCKLERFSEDELCELEVNSDDELRELLVVAELRLLLFAAEELGVGSVLTLMVGDSSETFPAKSIAVIE